MGWVCGLRLGAGVLVLGLCLGGARGQAGTEEEPDAAKAPITTLHVYMDLIQVPVLVLDPWMGRMKPIDPRRFTVSLDSGPPFRPKHVRQQGDDAIALGVLLDVSGEGTHLMQQMDIALARLAPEWLHENDHVTVMALDCGVYRSLRDISANPAQIKVGVDAALERWRERLKEKRRCERRVGLWDAMAYATRALSELPGRRVLLVVTDGVDRGSTTKWNDLRVFAQEEGVAVFGMLPNTLSRSTALGKGGTVGQLNVSSFAGEDAFDAICQMSGGMEMRVNFDPKRELERFTTILRERYILEFARARNDAPGAHEIAVSIANAQAYVRAAGVSVMMRDPDAQTDPTTIPRDVSDAPEIGKRKVLTPK